MDEKRNVLLRAPESFWGEIESHAAKRGITLQALILEVLSKRFKLHVEPPKRGRPKPIKPQV